MPNPPNLSELSLGSNLPDGVSFYQEWRLKESLFEYGQYNFELIESNLRCMAMEGRSKVWSPCQREEPSLPALEFIVHVINNVLVIKTFGVVVGNRKVQVFTNFIGLMNVHNGREVVSIFCTNICREDDRGLVKIIFCPDCLERVLKIWITVDALVNFGFREEEEDMVSKKEMWHWYPYSTNS